jgi:hypothetical protein
MEKAKIVNRESGNVIVKSPPMGCDKRPVRYRGLQFGVWPVTQSSAKGVHIMVIKENIRNRLAG